MYTRWVRVNRSLRLPLLLGALLLAGCDAGGVEGPSEGDRAAAEALEGSDVLQRITSPVEGGAVHLVRIVHQGDLYAFDPAEIVIRPGDVVRFIMAGSQPESVVFDPVEATAEAGDFVRGNTLHQGVLMTDAGQTYDVVFSDAPPGRYPFRSLPHGEQGMQGVVTVVEP
jgi:plastocyanin